ncbi:carboxypeptidase-like regulatory domain-containing protein [Aeromicrobium sp. IC_218]|uniref:carboxypeptidase-like regulatory domain-containing protein n=1 Tax=Aeromicrobium sp. IC_218 TaxID=2545468 RepID=UPI00103BF113|nr:carboxypeptidase-like regulatory domain-containing protein [Aeromicrobium sp. IC_218]TCI99176.1 carboxypeptidase regulatory-like domain-containing protein [Aeromicrobium sp. IC_218]
MIRRSAPIALVLALLASALGTSGSAQAADHGTMSGTVQHPSGDPTSVQISIRHASGQLVRTLRPQADGRWSVVIAPGTYRVRFDPASGDRSTLPQHWGGTTPADLVVRAGDAITGIDARLEEAGRVTVNVAPDPEASDPVQVRLVRVDDGAEVPTGLVSRRLRPGGSHVFDQLPAGTYRAHVDPLPAYLDALEDILRLSAPGYLWRDADGRPDLTVTAGGRTAIRVSAPQLSGTPSFPSVYLRERHRDGVFTLSTGTPPAGTSVVSRQWFAGRDGLLPLAGQDGTSFTAPPALRGQDLTVRLLLRDRAGRESALWSNAVPVMDVVESAGTVTLTPVVADSLVQAELSGTWPQVSHYLYRLFVDGRLIESNGYAEFRVPREAVGRTLTIEVAADAQRVRHVARASAVVRPASRRVVSRPSIRDARVESTPHLSNAWEIWNPVPDLNYITPDFRFQRQWYLDGKPIATPRKLSWRYGGRRLHARVTLTQAGYRTVTVDTQPVTVQLGRIYSQVRPDLNTLMVSVGDTVRASKGTWSVRPRSVRYQWYADKKPIKDASTSRLKVTKKLAGKRIRLKVTAGHPGYRSATRWSDTLRVNPWYPGQR